MAGLRCDLSAHCVGNANDLVFVTMQLLASGPSADIFRLADRQIVVAFAPPLYVSPAGVVYLDTSQLGEQVLQQNRNVRSCPDL